MLFLSVRSALIACANRVVFAHGLDAESRCGWEKRSLKGLEEVDPRNIDSAVLLDLAEKYGGLAFTAALKRQGGQFFPGEEKLSGGIDNLDDYSACKISQKQDWRDLFVTPFYFGCEADDPSNV